MAALTAPPTADCRLPTAPLESGRIAVLAAARRWLDTPFHDRARIRGVGVDCAQLVAAVYEEAGIVEHVETEAYSAQFMLHSREEKMLGYILKYAHEIEEAAVRPGDLVAYKVGRSFSHVAIAVAWPTRIIHAHLLSRKVVEMHGRAADLDGRETRFFSAWGREEANSE